MSHQESQDIQKGAGIAPAFEVRETDEHGTKQVAQNKLFPENESISEATWSSYKKNDDQPEQNYLFNLAYLFNVADHSEVEAANEETDVEEAAVKRAAVEETPAGEVLTPLAISLLTPSLDSDPSVRHVSNFKHVNQAVDTVGFQAKKVFL